MTDAEINEAVARALGLPGVKTYATGIVYVDITDPAFTEFDRQQTGARQRAVNWAQSLDACFRDLVPEAAARGLTLWVGASSGGWTDAPGWVARFDFPPRFGRDASPSRALCLAWLKTKAQPA